MVSSQKVGSEKHFDLIGREFDGLSGEPAPLYRVSNIINPVSAQ